LALQKGSLVKLGGPGSEVEADETCIGGKARNMHLSQRKRRIYRKNGVIQVWVDPGERQVEVISPTHGARTFGEGETAVIEELPGFELNLFPPPLDNVRA